MARRARFRTNYKGVGQILTSKTMQDQMQERAERLQSVCEAGSPEDSGTYRNSFRVETGIREGKRPRAQAKLINDARHATLVEWGTRRTPRYRVMGRAAGSA